MGVGCLQCCRHGRQVGQVYPGGIVHTRRRQSVCTSEGGGVHTAGARRTGSAPGALGVGRLLAPKAERCSRLPTEFSRRQGGVCLPELLRAVGKEADRALASHPVLARLSPEAVRMQPGVSVVHCGAAAPGVSTGQLVNPTITRAPAPQASMQPGSSTYSPVLIQAVCVGAVVTVGARLALHEENGGLVESSRYRRVRSLNERSQ